MRKWIALLLALALPLCALAEGATEAPLTPADYVYSGRTIRSYDSDSLRYTVEQFEMAGARCFVTKVWMAEPGRQIRKATATWEADLSYPSEMAKKIEGAALVINGSGYVSPVFPGIPDNYPGTSSDYYYTPLGSLTITDGQVYRNLAGVPYYGLTLEKDGLHQYVGADNGQVLAAGPTQTWSFYVGCPLIADHQEILDETWSFALAKAIRTIIARVDDHDYVILTVSARLSAGWSLLTATEFLRVNFDPVWAYNLDGGPSAALLCRTQSGRILHTVYGNGSKDTDIMAFTELP